MSINLGTYALVSALAVGGAVAQYQYSQPAGPPQDNATQQSTDTQQNGYSSTPMSNPSSSPLDCNGLMSRHQQMMQQLTTLDEQVNTQLSQMRDAKSDKAKLEATMGVVETLVTQRKQIRDHMMAMEHDTLNFVLANKGTDLSSSCPQMSQWLHDGATPDNTIDGDMSDRPGPDDLELGNDNTTTSPNTPNQSSPQNSPNPPNQNGGIKH